MRAGYAWDMRWYRARVNATEAARLTGYDRSQIHRLMRSGELPHVDGRVTLFVLAQLRARKPQGRKRKNG